MRIKTSHSMLTYTFNSILRIMYNTMKEKKRAAFNYTDYLNSQVTRHPAEYLKKKNLFCLLSIGNGHHIFGMRFISN